MKNIYEVMRQKEQQVQQLQKEIEALRTAAAILSESGANGAAEEIPVAVGARGPQPLETAKRWP